MSKNVQKVEKEFVDLIKKGRMNINTIENLMTGNIENYKKELRHQIEELLDNRIKENELIGKKNENGKLKDILSKIKEKQN